MSQRFAVTGITGNVGGYLADALLSAGHRVRGVVRDQSSGTSKALQAKGIELAVASFTDLSGLTAAFTGVDAVFIMTPPLMTSEDPRKESLLYSETFRDAILASKVNRVLLLSSIGAHIPSASVSGPIIKCYDTEQLFKPLASHTLAVTSLRPGYFAENSLHAISHAKVSSTFSSMIKLDTPLTVVTTKDIGNEAARLIVQKSFGWRVVEFEGPKRLNYNDIANIFFKLYGKTLPIVEVPSEIRTQVIKAGGISDAMATMFADLCASLDNGELKYEGNHEHVDGTHHYEDFLAEVFAKDQAK
jgi:uncharacterized protein YbjT (DUF2867 family)